MSQEENITEDKKECKFGVGDQLKSERVGTYVFCVVINFNDNIPL